MPEHANDAILLVKQFISSTCICQKPFLLFPHSWAMRLKNRPIQSLKRNELSKRELHEFRKTSERIKAHPWELTRASSYLGNLCSANEQGIWPSPPTLNYVFKHKIKQSLLCPAPTEWFHFAPDEPRMIRMAPAPKKHAKVTHAEPVEEKPSTATSASSSTDTHTKATPAKPIEPRFRIHGKRKAPVQETT